MMRIMTFSSCLFVLFIFGSALNASEKLLSVEDLRVFKQSMEDAEKPALLLFTTEDCEYCEAIRQDYLLPMIASGKYEKRILFRQVYMDEYKLIRNIKGRIVGSDEFALKYGVGVAPTILFIDSAGNELAERIVGISTIDYFDKLLDAHIAQAEKHFKR